MARSHLLPLLSLLSLLFLTPATWAQTQLPGTNYIEWFGGPINSITATEQYSDITVSGWPFATMDYHTTVTVTLGITHSNPSALVITLYDPADDGALIAYKSSPSNPCSTFFSTTVADNQTVQMNYEAATPAPECPPPIITAVGTDYFAYAIDYVVQFTGSGFTTAPFMVTFGGDAINGQWALGISAASGTGTLSSWSMRLYSENAILLYLFAQDFSFSLPFLLPFLLLSFFFSCPTPRRMCGHTLWKRGLHLQRVVHLHLQLPAQPDLLPGELPVL